ncbi:MAG: hypothetical protein J5682_09785 [Prevotella sp.]|nr:hypothetical protein [Prevotella sp.]
MKVKDLIAMLDELPQEADIYFSVGDNDTDREEHAKAEILDGYALSDLGIKEVKYNQWFTKEGEPEADGLVQLKLRNPYYSSRKDLCDLAGDFTPTSSRCGWQGKRMSLSFLIGSSYRHSSI